MKATRLKPPFVIVAHSLGALPARLFASQAGRPVAGLLLVDPSVEYQVRRMGGLANAMDGMIARARAAGRPMQASELEVLGSLSSDQVAQAGRLPNGIPLVVLTAGRSQGDAQAQARWAAMHSELAQLSSAGEQRVVAEAGHMIPRDRPELVAEATLELVRRVRGE